MRATPQRALKSRSLGRLLPTSVEATSSLKRTRSVCLVDSSTTVTLTLELTLTVEVKR